MDEAQFVCENLRGVVRFKKVNQFPTGGDFLKRKSPRAAASDQPTQIRCKSEADGTVRMEEDWKQDSCLLVRVVRFARAILMKEFAFLDSTRPCHDHVQGFLFFGNRRLLKGCAATPWRGLVFKGWLLKTTLSCRRHPPFQ
jgi:hypothetical protein